MSPFIRQVRAYDGETVEIRWTAKDGTEFYTRHTIPPKATRDAVTAGRQVLDEGLKELTKDQQRERP